MAMMQVNGVNCPDPSMYEFGLQDISNADSGRTQDATMHKNRIAQKRTISLEWHGVQWARTAQIMTMFNPEYISVTYPDMLSGTYETRVFYVGDRTAPVATWWDKAQGKLMSEVKLKIIEV